MNICYILILSHTSFHRYISLSLYPSLVHTGKCEENMKSSSIVYPNNQACDLIHGTLKRLDAAFNNKSSASVGLAWFFGIACFGLIGYVAWLHTKVINRKSVDLSSMGGTSA